MFDSLCRLGRRRLAVVVLTGLVLVSVPLAAQEAQEAKGTPEASTLANYDHWVTSLAFTDGGSQLVTGGGQSLLYRPGDVKQWDTSSGALVASLEGQPTVVWSVAASADGQKLITSGYDGKIIVWNVGEKKPEHTIEKKGWIRCMALASDGKHFAAAMEDGNVVIFEADGPKEIKTIKAHESAVYGVAFSPDGALLATCSTDKLAKVWDWNAGEEKAKLEGHDDAVWSVAFSPDGNLVATCSADRKVKLWNAAGKEQATLEGHRDWVTCVAFSPDGKRLATCSHDRTARVWNIETRQPTAMLGPHKSTCWSVAFSPDGVLVAVGTHNDGARLWEVPSPFERFPSEEMEEGESDE